MKILTLLLLIFPLITQAQVVALDEALEANNIRVEYIEQTKRGFVYPFECDLCTKKMYEFDSDTQFLQRGKLVNIELFLATYTQTKYFTLFVKPGTSQVLRLSF